MAKSATKATARREDERTTRRELQPTVHEPGTTDPVTNAAEARLQEDQRVRDEEEEKRKIAEQEEQAKKEQELFETRQNVMKSILQSDEGFVVLDDSNRDGIEEARKEGLVYHANQQRGIEVEERYYLSQKGYDALRTSLGPDMGKKKEK